MRAVGDKLAEWARDGCRTGEMDRFARSAFNRYYYAAFLEVREALRAMSPKYEGKLSHADIPNIIAKVCGRLRKDLAGLKRKGYHDTQSLRRWRSELYAAETHLADLFNMAREVRRLADYEPEVAVSSASSEFRLGGCSLSSARDWQRTVGTLASNIQRIKGDIGIEEVEVEVE